jgi:hypothetical protein
MSASGIATSGSASACTMHCDIEMQRKPGESVAMKLKSQCHEQSQAFQIRILGNVLWGSGTRSFRFALDACPDLFVLKI